MTKIILLFCAGGFGSLSRYLLSGVFQRAINISFPIGTYLVNVIGCFMFGLIWAYAQDRLSLSPEFRVIILTGFMGAFTTFSTFIFESAALLDSAQWPYFLLNVVGQIITGVILLKFGLALGRLI
ncbi:fluoride efflux transporter CrcB [Halodesulfovibrio sp. MK-HDV]|jgi:fluoride exporter|uniref:fluoride efflux transporter CrcB n=1 Tax=unclassified Halodesulfovibrio TaxID=2644657 RepID=UPI00136A000D|nr:fluoride efflux transporter CrcB [Halodesulfovibrio sp. MK-HDV]KAF1077740.1 putative fluoride ion transporter CrcB [Halodesulfovibrio sp. MK-HDV]